MNERRPAGTGMLTSRIARLILTALTATSLAVAGVALSGAPAQASKAAQWEWHQVDEDPCYDMATFDIEGNGYANDIWMDTDNDCLWDTRQWNTQGQDSFHERMSYDRNEDGSVNALLVDTNQQVGFEDIWMDRDDDGSWDAPASDWNSSYYDSSYSVVTDMRLAALRLGPGQWEYNPYL